MTTINLSAPDISCGGCANAIRRALTNLNGVNEVTVDVATKTVTVQYEESTASRDGVVAALDRAGFPATHLTESLPETGAHTFRK